jgi:hypothetical protein
MDENIAVRRHSGKGIVLRKESANMIVIWSPNYPTRELRFIKEEETFNVFYLILYLMYVNYLSKFSQGISSTSN